MHLESLHDKDFIQQLLETDRGRFAYLLGDLDPFFWARTVWYGAVDDQRIRAISLVYLGHKRPVVLCFGHDEEALVWLFGALTPMLPSSLDAHLEESLLPALPGLGWRLMNPALHLRMVLQREPSTPAEKALVGLGPSDLEALQEFYATSYPDNFFDPQMLKTGQYVGYRDTTGALLAVAGVHVFSKTYSVAALGNITTHPSHRGRGLGGIVTGALCAQIRAEGIQTIVLNVHAQNTAAIRMYQRLGFVVYLPFTEALAVRSPAPLS